MKLTDLKAGKSAIIKDVGGEPQIRKRIKEMGFVKGRKIQVVKSAPMQDPIEYDIMGYRISLRKSEAQHIRIATGDEINQIAINDYNASTIENHVEKETFECGKVIDVALVGNPNAGKTTLFNFASRSKEHVGNYSGVTIEAKEARFKQNGYTFNVIDLPGTYSLTSYSPEELYVRRYITNDMPDIVVNVVDAANLERNLYLTTQLIDMGVKVIIALNMYDDLIQSGDKLNIKALERALGIPIIPTVSAKGKGIKELFNKVIDVYTSQETGLKQIHINYGPVLEESIKCLQHLIWEDEHLPVEATSRFVAVKMLEKDKEIRQTLANHESGSKILEESSKQIEIIELENNIDTETLITDTKYGFISGTLKNHLKKDIVGRHKKTSKIDRWFTHRLLGIPIFVALLWLMFHTTFFIGQYPMDMIDTLIEKTHAFLSFYMPDGMFKDLVLDGVISGVGGVVIFLPNIIILFFFITMMEDTGYMARAAFIMDKMMHKAGLHGKSFIPLIMGFGCNVPAIMATRTLENRKDRLLTIAINPFMSCSARLPVYLLLVGTFFPNSAGLVLTSIYATGILIATVIALTSSKIWKKKASVPFVMELPPYRFPSLRTLLKNIWFKAAQYLKKMSGVILIASILIWALGYFPKEVNFSKNYDEMTVSVETQYAKNEISKEQHEKAIEKIKAEKESERIEKSYIGRCGKFVAPALEPLGFDWKMSVALITGAAAKEVIVSTMGVLYQSHDTDQLGEKLKSSWSKSRNKTENDNSSLGVTIAFLIFVLVYFPCVAVVAAIKKETGSWKWAAMVVGYTTGLAWLLAFVASLFF